LWVWEIEMVQEGKDAKKADKKEDKKDSSSAGKDDAKKKKDEKKKEDELVGTCLFVPFLFDCHKWVCLHLMLGRLVCC
jgi:hypothetical protein